MAGGYSKRLVDGRVAQRESTRLTREGSLVQSQSRPPFFLAPFFQNDRVFVDQDFALHVACRDALRAISIDDQEWCNAFTGLSLARLAACALRPR